MVKPIEILKCGEIRQGEEKVIDEVKVDYKLRDLLITIGWPGSTLRVYLAGSDGNRVPESSYEIIEKCNTLTVSMKDPPAGAYRIVVVGEDVPEEVMDYSYAISKQSGSFRYGAFVKDYWWIFAIALAAIIGLIILKKVRNR